MIGELLAGDPAVVGPYRLLGRLGTGGMGQVFLGQSSGGRLVAVKVIRPELAGEPGFRKRFAREVTSARNVSGLFTALVADADPDAAVPWLATAYIAGPSLTEAVEEHGVLPASSVAGLAAGLAEGLAAIHAAGVVHRDLKPSNVLLAHDGPRVIDFGISRAMESTMLTQTGMIMGSPGFLSPEQADGAEVGPPSDIFSLGAVLTFAATGEGPFGTGPTPALMYRVVNHEPDLARVPEELRALVERCLAKDPADRPTAADLLAELGGGRLAADWLPPPVAATLSRYNAPTQDVPPPAAGGNAPKATDPGTATRGGRRRWWLAAAAAVVLLAAGSAALALTLPGHGHSPVTDPTARQVAEQAAASARGTASPAASPSPSPRASVTKQAASKQAAKTHAGAKQATAKASSPQPVTETTAASVPPPPPAASSSRPAVAPTAVTQSAKPSTGVVPGVLGETQASAISALAASGFDNIPWLDGCYGSGNIGDVVTESPGAGTRLALTSPVHLDVQANNCVTMPDVIGDNLNSAISALEGVGFAASSINWRDECYTGTYPVNQVVTQSPAAGTSYGKTQYIALGVEADNCT